MNLALSLLLCLGFPLFARYAERRGLFPDWLSSIIACYLVGIVVSNLRLWPVDNQEMEAVAGASMLLGLPLLLFVVRLRETKKHAGSMLFAFALCCGSGLLCTGLVGWYLNGALADAEKIAGMLVGLYSGGTPNVQAIGLALDAPTEYVVLIQAADVLLGGAYLLGLVTFLPAVYARFYRPSMTEGTDETSELTEQVGWRKQLPQFGTGIAVTATAVGLTYLLAGTVDLTILVLLLTTLALAVSLSPVPARIGNSYPLGEYFILVFCVALGLMADFRALAADGMDLLYFSALALVSTTLLHLLLCKLFDVDRDTMMLSYVAGFYGPVFVVQMAAALRNKRLLAAGIAVSLLGLGIGNYLGIGLARLLEWSAA